ncbi:glycosyltransferase [Candidatus Bathyarchaeota archaeon]|nr:glycosyltransferase [Candidatus Bathyarchaeota archaeon]
MISIIVPTLNEEKTISSFFHSLNQQSWRQFEVIIVDGGSKDLTVKKARRFGAKVIVEPVCPEFESRNIGAEEANGDILLFTCADVIFPENLLNIVHKRFTKDAKLIALSGPGNPIDAPAIGYIEYELYNLFRYFLTKLPRKLKRFSTSTNFLAVRKNNFNKTYGFQPNDVNADGLMGKRLAEMGKISFSMDAHVHISARRMKSMGFVEFNKHYLYVLENFFPNLSKTAFIKKLKYKSGNVHGKMHE